MDEQLRALRDIAAKCVEAARNESDPKELARLLEVAEHWLALAEIRMNDLERPRY
jgi:hypothetical protein